MSFKFLFTIKLKKLNLQKVIIASLKVVFVIYFEEHVTVSAQFKIKRSMTLSVI